MKQYAIISHPMHTALIVSTNSHVFADYMLIGYSIVFQGNKKACEEIMSDELSLID